MSDHDEEDDDLPPITVSQSSKNEFEMPPAFELAEQRAREALIDRALTALNDEDSGLERSASQGSIGSDSEATLAAAVSALVVEPVSLTPEPWRAGVLLTTARELLPANTDTEFIDSYIQALEENDATSMNTITDQVLSGIVTCVLGNSSWSSSEIITVSTVLLLASAWGASGPQFDQSIMREVLHALLDDIATEEQVHALTSVVVGTLRNEGARLLAASDAARSGAGGRGDALANCLLRAAAGALLRDEKSTPPLEPPSILSLTTASLVDQRWRRLQPKIQLVLLQVIGRALAAAPWPDEEQAGGAAAVLEALTQSLPRSGVQRADRLKVEMGVSKLLLLFRAHRAPNSTSPGWASPSLPDRYLQQSMEVGDPLPLSPNEEVMDTEEPEPKRPRSEHRE